MFVSCRKGVSKARESLKPLLTLNSDGNIRYYEYQHDKFEYLSEYKSADPQRGVAFLPKRGLNVHENEVMRAFKTVNDSYIEPISFIVPRRAEVFQGDIYPPVTGTKPAMSSGEWFEGKDALPPKIDLESVYAGEEPAEVPSTSAPMPRAAPAANIPSPTKKEPESVKSAPQPSPVLRAPPPSVKEQASSIANMASKFADKDDVEDEDEDSSSFEEIPKPVDRADKQMHMAPKPEEHSEPVAISKGLSGTSTQPPASNSSSSTAPAPKTDSQTLKVPPIHSPLNPARPY